MITLTQAKNATDQVFENDLVLPEIGHHHKRKLEAFKEANLDNQYRNTIFDIRCEQAETLGFKPLELDEMVKMLMGESCTENKPNFGYNEQRYEFFYNHLTEETYKGSECKWEGVAHDFYNKHRGWIFSKTNWQCRLGKLNYLAKEIPYGVALRLNEVKKLNLFNVFNVLAPIEAWEKDVPIDPIVVATIWSIKDGNSYTSQDSIHRKTEKANPGKVQYYFLAQW